MLDDLLIRTDLRKLVDNTVPVTVEPAQLRQLRKVFTAVDRQRSTIRRLGDRVGNCERRIAMLRRVIEGQTSEAMNRTADYMRVVQERDAALAERDRAVLARDNTLAELHATEEQVEALRADRDRLALELAELKLQRAQGAA